MVEIIHTAIPQPGAKRPDSVTVEKRGGRVIFHLDPNHAEFAAGLTWIFGKNAARAQRENALVDAALDVPKAD